VATGTVSHLLAITSFSKHTVDFRFINGTNVNYANNIGHPDYIDPRNTRPHRVQFTVFTDTSAREAANTTWA
jgi:hypothetical protein